MTDEQIELLVKALDLYDFTIEQRRKSKFDGEEAKDFRHMKEALSAQIGVDLMSLTNWEVLF